MIQFFSYLAATVLISLLCSVHFLSTIAKRTPKIIKIGLKKKANARPRPDFFDGDLAGGRPCLFKQGLNIERGKTVKDSQLDWEFEIKCKSKP